MQALMVLVSRPGDSAALHADGSPCGSHSLAHIWETDVLHRVAATQGDHTCCPGPPPQALPKDEKQNEGRVPRPIDVELCEDLVGACQPGDVVTVVGMVRVLPGEATAGGQGSGKRQGNPG